MIAATVRMMYNNVTGVLCVTDIEPFSDSINTETHVTEGDAVIFDLPTVDSCPPATIHWVDASGKQLSRTAENHHITLTNDLVILNTRYDVYNSVEFRAVATNGYTQQTTSSALYVLRVQREYTDMCTCLCYLSVCLSVCLSVHLLTV